jgi:hypothetical protein
MAGLPLECTADLVSHALQNRSVAHRGPASYALPCMLSSSSLASARMHHRIRCIIELLRITGQHSYVLPCLSPFPHWPTAQTHRWPPFVRVAKPRSYTSLAYIHTRCRDCPHPPGWPTARTHHRPTFVRTAEPRCYTTWAYIHTRCSVCPHPAPWATART